MQAKQPKVVVQHGDQLWTPDKVLHSTVAPNQINHMKDPPFIRLWVLFLYFMEKTFMKPMAVVILLVVDGHREKMKLISMVLGIPQDRLVDC